MRYGEKEWQFAQRIARALVKVPAFRTWVLEQTRFAPYAAEAQLLHEKMKELRSRSAETWWRSHYTEKCRCPGCCGQETDLLAIFSAGPTRFALHCEVKRPGDKFPRNKDQARNYGLRARCWVKTPPKAVLPHHEAGTVLIYSEAQREEFSLHIEKFDASFTFEEANTVLPPEFWLPVR